MNDITHKYMNELSRFLWTWLRRMIKTHMLIHQEMLQI